MNTRLLRRTLSIGGLCLLVAFTSVAQKGRSRHPAGAKGARTVLTPLSPATIASIAKATAVTLPWFDDMENGAPGWTSTGFWHLPYRPQQISVLRPTLNPDLVTLPDAGNLPAPNSGNYCWWYGEDATGTFIGKDFSDSAQTPLNGGESRKANSGNLVTPPISLVGQTNAVLSFATWWEIEGVESNAFDLMEVLASSDGGATWDSLGRGVLNPLNDPSGESWKPYSSNGLGQRGSWTEQFFDLTKYAGDIILIRFTFSTEDNLYNGFRGWFIDDVSVTSGTFPAPVITAVTPPVVNTTFTSVVSIIGANFVSGATIQVDATPVNGAVMNSSVAQFDASGLAAGSHGVSITNPDGKVATKIRSLIVTTVVPPLYISVQPDSAPAGVSIPITITGNHFQSGVSVSIGGVIAPVQKVFDSTSISARTPATLPVGRYNIVVANPDSLSDLGLLSFNVTPFVYNAGDSVVGKAQPLRIAPVDSSYRRGRLWYRITGKTVYDSVDLSGDYGNFSATLPANAVTIRGVEYYVTLFNLQGVPLSFPSVSPSLFPAILPVRVARVFPPVPPVGLKYRMFSSPMVLDNPRILTQLADDLGPYNPAQWRVFRWIRNGYRELFPFVGLSLEPGSAYWIVTATGTPFSLKRGVSVPGVQPYIVPVDTGWNQIADPFAFNVAWDTLANYSLVGPYYYDGTQYRVVRTVLKPFEGYFVYNPPFSETSQIVFYPVESAAPALYRDDASSTAPGPGEFVMQISAGMPGTDLRDTYNYIGLRRGASAGRDRLDAPKPPPIGDALQVEIVDAGMTYQENFKPVSGEGQSWVFDVRATGTKGNAVLALTPSGVLPSGYSVHVLDLKDENALPSASGTFTVPLDAPNTPRYYKVIVGTASYAANESNGIPLQPVAYALGQNYPNPFNPATTIRYSIAKRSDVTLEIYNTLGQRVRMLFNGSRMTGEYETVWDGTNDGGAHVASGVYFYRLRTGEFSAVRKLVMIR